MAEEDKSWIEPYDFRDLRIEPRPDLVVYQPCFDKLKTGVFQVVDLIRDPLLNSAYNNTMTEALLREAQDIVKESFSSEVMFAIVGDMASGKSSLINSILSIGVIARKGDPGTSCTWVVQRFMKMFPDQKSPFAAKVYFFSSADIRAILKSHLGRYYRASRKAKAGEDDAESSDGDEDDYNEKITIIETFMPLFCDHEEFESADMAMRFLDRLESEDDETTLELLVSWTEDIQDKCLKGHDCVDIATETSEDLIDRLQPYTFTAEDELSQGQVQPWPLVKTIDFGLDIPLLADGMILVDSPGISDANSTRANNAKENHRNCRYKIHVAKVGRARDDKSLRDAMAKTYRKRGSQNTILVLTHGDDIDDTTDPPGSPAAKQMLRSLQSQIRDLKSRKNKLGVLRKSADDDEETRIDEELDEIKEKLKPLTREQFVLRLKMRNESTKNGVQEKYKQISKDPRPLPIHIVANDDYITHQTGYFAYESPKLSVEDTGIPALRQKIYSLPAAGQLNKALHLALHQLPSLVNSVEIYCSKTHLTRKSVIEGILKKSTRAMQSKLIEALEKLQADARTCVLTPMEKMEDKWIIRARKLCKQWEKLPSRQHLQLLKKSGRQEGNGKERKDICWNTELLVIHETAMDECFKNLREALLPFYEQLYNQICNVMETAKTEIKDDQQNNPMALEPLTRSIRLQRPQVCQCINDSLRDLKQRISDTLEDTTDPQDGLFAGVMTPIYNDVSKIKKKNAPKLRLAEFEKRVCRTGGVWMKTHAQIEDRLNVIFKSQLVQLKNGLDTVFNGFASKFDMLCNDTLAKTEEEKEQEDKLVAKLTVAREKAQEMMQHCIEPLASECKNYSAVQEDKSLFVSED